MCWPPRFALLWRGFGPVTRDLLLYVEMFGALVLAILRVSIRPRSFRLTSMVHHVDRVCWRAVPIILPDHVPDRSDHRAAGHHPFPADSVLASTWSICSAF